MRVKSDSPIEQDEIEVEQMSTQHMAEETGPTPEADGDATNTDDADTDGADDSAASADESSGEAAGEDVKPVARRRKVRWSRAMAFGVLPVLALLLAAAAGFLKWQLASSQMSEVARVDSLAAAKESTVALLSYQPGSVDKDLGAARERLTGKFKESYTQLVQDVVAPGAKKDRIAAAATVPAAASLSATPNHAVALLFVDQTVTVGNDVPADTASTVRVTLDKCGDRWLISSFDPV